MANRMKEDERNERTIRGLLKLPENRRCINCNSLGPQYVCTNFWTFVCTTCSGIQPLHFSRSCHGASDARETLNEILDSFRTESLDNSREFTHRVKSVSMAKFTSQEVSALQGGGNERAKEIYFKEWDSQRHSVPDSSNVERLRDFIKHVYVDRRYTGERRSDKPPRVKMGDGEDSFENRRADTYRSESQSPPYEDTYERRYSERSGPGGRNDDRDFRSSYGERRSPGYDQENQRYGDRRSPARFEVVDDWRRDDRFGNGRRSEDRRFSDGDSKLEGRSPNHQKDLDMSSPPMVRPIRDILGEHALPLRVGEPPKANGGRAADGSAHTQRTASSSSLGSIDGSSVELKGANPGSLIDFNDDPEAPGGATVPQTQQTPPPPIGQSVTLTQPTSSSIDDGNWASFDFATPETVSQAPSNANTLESVLSQLSAPAALPLGNMSTIPNSGVAPATAPVGNMSTLTMSGGAPAAPIGHMSTLPYSVGAPASAPVSNISTLLPSGGVLASAPGGMPPMLPITGGDSYAKANDVGQWPSMQQHQPSLFPATDSHSTAQQFTPLVGGASNNQPWVPSHSSNAHEFLGTTVQSSQAFSKPTQDTRSVVVSQPLPVEAKASGRKELPEDFFTASYSSVPLPVPGWQNGQPHGMRFSMQYPTAAPMPTFPHSSRSINPFDLNSEPTLIQAPMFPSMASLQGALPNMSAPTGLLGTSSLGTPSPQWMPPQSSSYVSAMPPQSPSYASAMPPQSPYYASAMPPSSYMGQQLPSDMQPFGHQGVGGLGIDRAVFGTLNTNQQLAGRYSAPATLNSFSSVGGNPFG